MNVRRPVHVIGAGGHAKVVAATLRAAGYEILQFFDDDPARWGQTMAGGIPIQGPIASAQDHPDIPAVLAIGDNRVRQRLSGLSLEWLSVVHPRALVEERVTIGPGTVVFAGAILQPEVRIGAHCIVNTAASVDHECMVGDFVHLAPGSRLAGAVTIEEGAMVGIGASIILGVTVGAWSMVGASAAVIRDVPAGITFVGVPARPIEPRSR
jgi:sugar O-acyltransferase (sialic acid O-acetyltransferase NeuD family)